MVYRFISTDMKQRALTMLQEGWEVTDIVDALDVSSKSIGRWEDNLAKYGTVSQHSNLRGRPRALNAAAIEDISDLILEAPSLFLEEIAEWLAVYHDQPIHTSALHRTLRDLGLTYKALRKAAAERDEVAVAEWLLMVTSNYTAEQCIWLDESSKDDRTLSRQFGRSLAGQRAVDVTPLERGIRYSILPALTLDGYIALRVVEGSVDGGEFYDFVVNDVIPKMNPYPQTRSILIMDNCGTHRSEALRLAVEAANCVLLFLPAYSPHLNPIEQSFSCVKAYLRHHWRQFQDTDLPIVTLLEACMTAVTAQKAACWIADSGYTIN